MLIVHGPELGRAVIASWIVLNLLLNGAEAARLGAAAVGAGPAGVQVLKLANRRTIRSGLTARRDDLDEVLDISLIGGKGGIREAAREVRYGLDEPVRPAGG